MEAQFQDLRIKRSSLKGQVTKFNNYLNNLKFDEPLSEVKFNELLLKFNRIIDLPAKFDELRTYIEVLNPHNLDGELSKHEEIQNNFHLYVHRYCTGFSTCCFQTKNCPSIECYVR